MNRKVTVSLLLSVGAALALGVMWREGSGRNANRVAMPRFAGGVPQGHVYTGCADEPADVNPLTCHEATSQRLVLAYTHDALLDRDPRTGELRPALAESHELAADGRSCTFTLRQGVLFADGTPLTLDDVLFGWQLAQAGHLPMGSMGSVFQSIERVDVLDERRFCVHFRSVHYAALDRVGTAWRVPSRRFFVERVRARLQPEQAMPTVETAEFAELLNQIDRECGPGTGPYQLCTWDEGQSGWRPRQDLLLERNEHCWRREVTPGCWNFAGVRTLFRDPTGATNALLGGEVDWFSSPMLDELLAARPDLARSYRRLVYDYNQLGVYRIVWNCRSAPYDDPRVRLALGMLVPRDEIVHVLGGAAHPAAAHCKPGSAAYPKVQPLPFDPRAARRLLREAGFDPAIGKRLTLRLLALQGSDALRRIAELFADACQQAGVDLQLQGREMAAFIQEKQRYEWQGLLVQQYFNPWGDPMPLLHSDGLDNEGAFRDARVDALIEAAQRELDAGRRDATFCELHQLVHELQPAALIVHPMASILLNSEIRDAVPGPFGLIPERAWVSFESQRR